MPTPVDPAQTATAPRDQQASAASNRDETLPASDNLGPHPAAGSNFGPPAAADEVGTLGPYRILKKLGAGGMGAVYLALDTRLDRKLALKVMLPEYAADAAAKERFLREAKAAAKVSHDNVVIVHEADERDGVPYIAMQFLQGYPLDEFLKTRGTPPLPHIIRIARETALGLAAAHALGLVHRDIKPANLWLEAPNGRVKVLDFGLAKPIDSDAELTKSGAVVGTPAYMSPEQARGVKVDHRTDLFSLGAVLYRLCTGQNPFSGPTVLAVLMALGSDEPTPVRELNPNVPESLAAFIHQLLAKKPEDRPQTATEVARRLRAILDELLTPTPVAEAAVPMATAADVSLSQPVVVHPLPLQPPVVVPMSVSAQPESAFANLDAESTAQTQPDKPKPARRKSSGRGIWIATGLAVLLAAVAGVIVIKIKNKDGTETEIKVPDGSTVTIEKNGQEVVKVGPDAGKNTPAVPTGDRAAAEWVLSIGGTVRVNDAPNDINAAADLPKDAFKLTFVGLAYNAKVSDAGLAYFKDCKNFTHLDLNHTQVSDVGLANFKDCKNLTYLNLGDCPKVSDAGLAHFKDCKNLTYLGLDTLREVGDAGVAHFKDCKNLTHLELYLTKVTRVWLTLRTAKTSRTSAWVTRR